MIKITIGSSSGSNGGSVSVINGRVFINGKDVTDKVAPNGRVTSASIINGRVIIDGKDVTDKVK